MSLPARLVSDKAVVGCALVAVLLLGSGCAGRVSLMEQPQAALAAAAPVATTSSGTVPGILVSGTATVSVTPDLARIVVSVETQAVSATQAESDNAATVARVRSRLRSAGAADSDIKTVNLNVWPQYDYRGTGQPVLTGFTAYQTLEVTVHDVKRIGAVIDAAIAGGATSVQGVSYDASDRSGREAAALAQAVKDAQLKARAMADAAGVKLGSVVSMTDTIQSMPYPFPIYRAGAAPSSAGTQVSPPDVQLTVQVTVGWSIG